PAPVAGYTGQFADYEGLTVNALEAIRAAGGDVIPSFGGYSGNKLGPNCSSAAALAGAYQQVINAFGLKAIDIDVENTDEFENEAVQDRILGALKIVKQNNPGIKTIVTIGTATTGPTWWGTRLINQAAALQANVDVFTIMPFDFGGGANMYQNTVNAAEGLKTALRNAFGWSDATAYAHMGISGMNGLSDQQELTTPAIWTQIRDWAAARGLARFTFWSVNRDRACPGGGVVSNCSGIAQNAWEFTSITARFG
ncbi:chitinase, partial [Micromonospora zhanjiangensis]